MSRPSSDISSTAKWVCRASILAGATNMILAKSAVGMAGLAASGAIQFNMATVIAATGPPISSRNLEVPSERTGSAANPARFVASAASLGDIWEVSGTAPPGGGGGTLASATRGRRSASGTGGKGDRLAWNVGGVGIPFPFPFRENPAASSCACWYASRILWRIRATLLPETPPPLTAAPIWASVNRVDSWLSNIKTICSRWSGVIRLGISVTYRDYAAVCRPGYVPARSAHHSGARRRSPPPYPLHRSVFRLPRLWLGPPRL